jgi:hypothetical protein
MNIYEKDFGVYKFNCQKIPEERIEAHPSKCVSSLIGQTSKPEQRQGLANSKGGSFFSHFHVPATLSPTTNGPTDNHRQSKSRRKHKGKREK